MYSSFDYISLGEVLHDIESSTNIELGEQIKGAHSYDARELIFESVKRDEDRRWKVLRHFSQQPSYSACLTSGGVVRLSPEFLDTNGSIASIRFAFHPCLSEAGNLSVENVSNIIHSVEKHWSRPDAVLASAYLRHMRTKIAPLDGASIQVNIRHSIAAVDEIELEVDTDRFSESELVTQIISLTDKGMRRDDVKICFALDYLWNHGERSGRKLLKLSPTLGDLGQSRAGLFVTETSSFHEYDRSILPSCSTAHEGVSRCSDTQNTRTLDIFVALTFRPSPA